MSAVKIRKREEESYFVSMTDMMVGLLFVFIIMLMYFALQFHTNAQKLVTADETRASILEHVRDALKSQGVTVEIDTDTGVLRLPDNILFPRGDAKPTPQGVDALQKLAHALDGVIPCYAFNPDPTVPRPCKPPPAHTIELLYIEGHTDSTPIYRGERIQDNWDLSNERAKNVRQYLIQSAPILERLLNAPKSDRASAPILSHMGQADSRKICEERDKPDPEKEACAAKNRRIDLRIIMAKPKPQEAAAIESAIGSKP